MSLHTTYWYMLPVSVLVATVAMLTGVGGSKFFAPIFLILLKLEPHEAFGVALFTQSFGFLSGFMAYSHRRSIDYGTGVKLLAVTIPVSLLAVSLGRYIPAVYLERLFAVILIGLSLAVLGKRHDPDPDRPHQGTSMFGLGVAAAGGGFLGLISVGLGELLTPYFLIRQRYSYALAIGTTVFIVFVTTLVASASHLVALSLSHDQALFQKILDIVAFTIPGVLIGGQLAPMLTMKVKVETMKQLLRVSFVVIGSVMLLSSHH